LVTFERRIEVDQINRLVGYVATKYVEIVAVVEPILHPTATHIPPGATISSDPAAGLREARQQPTLDR